VKARVAAAAITAAVLVGAWLYAPMAESGPVLCPVHGVLGLPCPSCGLTRGFCAVTRLEFREALVFHALSLPLFAACLVTPFVAVYEILVRRRTWVHAVLFSRTAAVVLATVIVSYHLARLGFWLMSGSLMGEYVQTSWTYALLQSLGILGG